MLYYSVKRADLGQPPTPYRFRPYYLWTYSRPLSRS